MRRTSGRARVEVSSRSKHGGGLERKRVRRRGGEQPSPLRTRWGEAPPTQAPPKALRCRRGAAPQCGHVLGDTWAFGPGSSGPLLRAPRRARLVGVPAPVASPLPRPRAVTLGSK